MRLCVIGTDQKNRKAAEVNRKFINNWNRNDCYYE